jgi:YihY family inner membrane protein
VTITSRVRRLRSRVDGFQRRHRPVAIGYAVVKRFGDDRAADLAALVAYYAFFSLFPLLLALVTILGFVLSGHPGLQRDIVSSTLARFPVIGHQLRQNVGSLHGSGLALALGLAALLWAGLAAMRAGETALNTVWGVPIKRWPNALATNARALLMLVVLGGGTVVSTVISGLGTFSGSLGLPARVGAMVATTALNVALFLLAFRILPSIDPRWRDVLPGAVVAGVAWTALQAIGGLFVDHQLRGASETYGTFAVVIGLLSWLYLQAQITLLAAELNVVLVEGLWPRSLSEHVDVRIGPPRPLPARDDYERPTVS